MKLLGFDRRFVSLVLKIRRRDVHNSRIFYDNVQGKRAAAILQSAARDVPFHGERLKGITWEHLHEVPVTDKKAMMAALSDTVSRKELESIGCTLEELQDFCDHSLERNQHWLRDYALLSQTHGTTGVPSRLFRTRREMQVQSALNILRAGYSKRPIKSAITSGRRKVASILFDNPWTTSNQGLRHYSKVYSRFADFKGFLMAEEPHVLASQLNEYQPDEVRTYPVYHVMLAKLQMQGVLQIDPQYICTGADLMTAQDRKMILTAFPNAKILDVYAATECHPMAARCEHGNFHINSDYVIFQPLDKEDNLVEPDVWSDSVAVTCLMRSFQPTIRYRITDSVRLLSQPCPCGRVLPVMEIRGRRFPALPIVDNQGNETDLSSVDIRRVLKPLRLGGAFILRVDKRSHFDFSIIVSEDHPEVSRYQEEMEPQIRKLLVDFFQKRNCENSIKLKFDFIRATLKPGDVKHRRFRVSV
ncbi:MAG: hypothetical protein KTR24_14500 [Saprospiraceae bacterium]|nr:hypothetical protein [Saprospiraceae bacterium]